ncbi:response regulator transcription factor [Niabella sp. CJ426]|jgi:DNA-binding response OmpR family regulator|uniref:response regulator transcription factor n=1 Tax=Niabella sp. CJ426 TaxID=3393740 RepID=UPI003D01CF5C
MKSKILFVEDEIDLGNVVKQYLQLMNFEVDLRTTAEEALETFKQRSEYYDLLITDIQLPGMDGFEFAGEVKKANEAIPFLFLTARNEKKDRIAGLKLGADDYINKPFDIDELVLRVTNIIRRNSKGVTAEVEHGNILKIGDIVFRKDVFKISVGNAGKSISLTVREANLLEYMYQNKNTVIKREDILIQLWGENDYFLGRSLDVFISRLRKLLAESKKVKIENVYGVGFIFSVK